jgi:hypothetical protein
MATTSRRGLLAALTAAPLVVVPSRVTSPWDDALAAAHEVYGDDPIALVRSRDGRILSRSRYHNAEGFFRGIGRESRHSDHLFYDAGIVAQLALSTHLLDIGFDDSWCARHVGLRVTKALAYANATGLGHDCADMARLAVVLTPYWKWNTPRLWGEPAPDDGGFAVDHIRHQLRNLLDRVREVTGHPRPSRWRRRIDEGWTS